MLCNSFFWSTNQGKSPLNKIAVLLICQFLLSSFPTLSQLIFVRSGEGARLLRDFLQLLSCSFIHHLWLDLLSTSPGKLVAEQHHLPPPPPPSCLLSVEPSWATSSCKISAQFSAEALWEWIVSTSADFDWHSLKDKLSYTIGRGRYSLASITTTCTKGRDRDQKRRLKIYYEKEIANSVPSQVNILWQFNACLISLESCPKNKLQHWVYSLPSNCFKHFAKNTDKMKWVGSSISTHKPTYRPPLLEQLDNHWTPLNKTPGMRGFLLVSQY